MVIRWVLLFMLLAIGYLSATTTSTSSSSGSSANKPGGVTPMQPKSMPGSVYPKSQTAPPKKTNLVIPPKTTSAPGFSGELFFHPGMLFVKDGKWVESDNFTSLPKSIAIQVNIVKPEDLTVPVEAAKLEAAINTVFSNAGMTRMQSGEQGGPPLPFFSLVIMIYRYKEGFAAANVARLFEQVNLSRLTLDPNQIFQAITWEQTGLVVANPNEFENLLTTTVQGIADNFVKRVATYQAPPTQVD